MMSRKFGETYLLLLLVGDLALTEVALYLASLVRVRLPWGLPLGRQPPLNPLTYVLVAVIWLAVFLLLSVWDPRRMVAIVDDLQGVTLAVIACALVFAGTLYLSYRDISRLLFAYFIATDLVLLLGFRIFLHLIFRLIMRGRRHSITRVLIIGAGKAGRKMAQAMRENRAVGLRPVGFLDDAPAKQGKRFEGVTVLGELGSICQMVKEHEVDEVVFALPLRAHRKLVNLVIDLQRLPVNVRVVPDFFDLAFFQATTEDFGGLPLISLREPAINGHRRVVKRAFDLAMGAMLLVLFAPSMALIALLIKLDSEGPAIFKQERVGENCKPFQMYKFRSMVSEAEERLDEVLAQTEDGKVIHKVENDPRVTRLGRFLRCTSLDELPQLFNVLKGEMSLVGPRPEMPWLVDRYEPWQLKRFAVPQGITGWWQVHGRSDKPMHLHTEEDLYYIQHYSLLLDIQILFMTIGAVLNRRGAY